MLFYIKLNEHNKDVCVTITGYEGNIHVLLWKIVQTMKALNIPYPHLAMNWYPHEVNKKNKINQPSIKNQSLKCGQTCASWGRAVLALSLSPLTRSFLMINANSNDSSPVSCVRSHVVPSGVARVTRGAPAPLRWGEREQLRTGWIHKADLINSSQKRIHSREHTVMPRHSTPGASWEVSKKKPQNNQIDVWINKWLKRVVGISRKPTYYFISLQLSDRDHLCVKLP